MKKIISITILSMLATQAASITINQFEQVLTHEEQEFYLAGLADGIVMGNAVNAAFGNSWWSMALALAITTSVMLALRVAHPPACSNPIAIFIITPEWGFLLAPTLLGAFLITVIALIYNNLASERVYPKYW